MKLKWSSPTWSARDVSQESMHIHKIADITKHYIQGVIKKNQN